MHVHWSAFWTPPEACELRPWTLKALPQLTPTHLPNSHTSSCTGPLRVPSSPGRASPCAWTAPPPVSPFPDCPD